MNHKGAQRRTKERGFVFQDSDGKHKKETASLISENFQLFTDVFIPAA
jgi:hypothetical protein